MRDGFYREETISGYTVSAGQKAHWAVSLALLEALMAVCEAHGLTYMAVYGTLLGAVRHGGFIPWDDDIDIAMPRADYDRLQELAPAAFAPPFFLQTPENDPETFNTCLKLRHSGTAFFNKWDLRRRFNKGCAIDILPLDGVPPNPLARWRRGRALAKTRRLLGWKAAWGDWDPAFIRDAKSREIALAVQGLSQAALCEEYHALCARYTGQSPRLLAPFGGRTAMPPEAWATTTLPFEHLRLPVPAGYDTFIRLAYGDGAPPDDEARAPAHRVDILDTEHSYKDYDRRYTDVFADLNGAPIYLFGAGNMLGNYLRSHGEKYPPAGVFDNDPAKWGTRVRGLEVHAPAELPGLLAAGGRLIIANIYHEEIGAQLEAMGIGDYFIYTEGKLYGEAL